MIYLTPSEVAAHYGRPTGGLKSGRFNSKSAGLYREDAYKYEFGYLNERCLYAIIQKVTGSSITLEEAQGLRLLSGKGEWKSTLALDPKDNAADIQKILDDLGHNLGYTYIPTDDDQYKHPLICVHQKHRQQLVIYHPKWRPDLSEISSKPI